MAFKQSLSSNLQLEDEPLLRESVGKTNAQTTAYTALPSDETKVIRFTGAGGVNLNLTAAATLGDGWFTTLINDTSGDITIDPDGSETINGGATLVVETSQAVMIYCNGTLFYTLGEETMGGVSVHDIGGAAHDASSAADFNTKISDGNFGVIDDATPSTARVFSSQKVSDEIAILLAGAKPVASCRTSSKIDGNINLASAPAAIDGVTMANDDRVCVSAQTTVKDNGIYDYNGSGSAMTRSADFDGAPTAEVADGRYTQIIEGTEHSQHRFMVINSGTPVVVGTDDINWDEHLDIVFGTSAGTAAEGNDSRLNGLVTKSGTQGSFSGNPKKATVTLSGAFADANYSVSIIGQGGDDRSWTIESQLAGSFVINSNANPGLSNDALWIAIKHGES